MCRPNQAASSQVQAAAGRTRGQNAANTSANLCNMRSDLHALAPMQPNPLGAAAKVCQQSPLHARLAGNANAC